MKFKTPCILYYVCPFVFNIEKVRVDMCVEEMGGLHYIDQTGAYLKEHDLFKDLEDAKKDALAKLEKFNFEKRIEILKSNPTKINEDF